MKTSEQGRSLAHRLRLTSYIGSSHTPDSALFNLANDPGETQDLGRQQPERLRDLATRWDDYARANGVILPDDVTNRP